MADAAQVVIQALMAAGSVVAKALVEQADSAPVVGASVEPAALTND